MLYSAVLNGKNQSSTSSFNVIYRSPTTIKVNLTYASSAAGAKENILAWILKNGTAIAAYVGINGKGMNLTSSVGGMSPNTMVEGVFAGYYQEIEADMNQGYYGASQYFHATGTRSVTIGGNSVTVTDYTINSPNETVNICGTTSTFKTFVLEIGTPSGASFPLTTKYGASGTGTFQGTATTFDFMITLTGFTVA
jgi:hypothetical protein